MRATVTSWIDCISCLLIPYSAVEVRVLCLCCSDQSDEISMTHKIFLAKISHTHTQQKQLQMPIESYYTERYSRQYSRCSYAVMIYDTNYTQGYELQRQMYLFPSETLYAITVTAVRLLIPSV